MRVLSSLILRFRSLFRRRAAEGELDDELRFHLERTIEQNLARGLPREEARRQALVEIGGVEQVKEECREARGWHFVEDTWRDVTYGARMLRKSPGFAVVAILTLALGIGANVSMLGVVDALLFRLPAHIRSPQQLVQVGLVPKRQANLEPTASYPQFLRLSENAHLLGLAAEGPRVQVGFGRGLAARQIYAEYASPTYFRVLGVHMLMGRAFDATEDQPTGSRPVVVLGYDLWHQAFGGNPKVLGRTVLIDGQARTVVGMAPKGFTGTGFLSVDAWLPIHAFQGFVPLSSIVVRVLGRLRQGVTAEQAAAEVTSILSPSSGPPKQTDRLAPFMGRLLQRALHARQPVHIIAPTNQVGRAEPLFAGRWSKLSPNARISLWIAGVALIVLLIACVNVSSLLLARMAQRRHEIAVRQQLGATRGRLMRQVLTEGLLIGAAGGMAALIVALVIQPLVRSFLLPTGFYESGSLSWRTLGVAAGLAALAGCASGLAPAWRAGDRRLADTIKWGERGHTREGSGLRWVLVVTQLALTLLLTVGAGLFIRSLRKADAINLGFEPDRLLLASVDLPHAEFNAAEIQAAYARLRARAERVPGVKQVAIANMAPFWRNIYQTLTVKASSGQVLLHWIAAPHAVTPNYFSTLEMRILEGRPLLDSDTAGAPPVVVVNQSLARALWPEQNPLGKCMRVSIKIACSRVVGVVADTSPRFSISRPAHEASEEFYVPLRQAAQQGTLLPAPTALLIHAAGKPAAVAADLFSALEGVAPGGRFVTVEPYSKMLDSQTRSWRMGASMFSLFGVLALVLAAVGIYGVLAFLVRQRTAEIGMRMALGATPGNVLRMVIGEGMKVAAIGIAIGAGAALGLTRWMKSLLYGVSATDAVSFITAAAILALVALLACSLAARRAMRVDPNVALRNE